ncbi:MAG: hydroxymethylglutaryl-CoA synthase [Holosporaceae bacterium]|jgi:hydroxymethylglutaryl-CoA synthase|nr:hydroxymethylglutaryl-CoA synthase [Holosporaceae bacterium]
MKIGIDSAAFSTSKYFLSLETLARRRNVDFAKYCSGIGQTKMAVFPPNEDIVTVGADAAEKALAAVPRDDIDMLIFATESSFDLSKSAGIYVHHFLNLREDCRVFDLKQACYSVTAALRLAISHVAENPDSRVLVVGSDVVRYPPNTPGEPTQGGAAVALVVSKDPRILEVEPQAGVHTVDVTDFWRPAHLNEALFDGKLSARNYLKSLDICVDRYFQKTNLKISDIDHACFHAPFGKMALKADRQLFGTRSIDKTLVYNSVIGNSCSASLYICFISLTDNSEEDLSGRRTGFFSYGSGSVAEFFCGVISENYKCMSNAEKNRAALADRTEISFREYESFCNPEFRIFDRYQNAGNLTLSGVSDCRRVYKILEPY